jgi:hypothetical protein
MNPLGAPLQNPWRIHLESEDAPHVQAFLPPQRRRPTVLRCVATVLLQWGRHWSLCSWRWSTSSQPLMELIPTSVGLRVPGKPNRRGSVTVADDLRVCNTTARDLIAHESRLLYGLRWTEQDAPISKYMDYRLRAERRSMSSNFFFFFNFSPHGVRRQIYGLQLHCLSALSSKQREGIRSIY